MAILYIVPNLKTNGGIQEFAKSIYNCLNKKFEIAIHDWENDLNIFENIILRRLQPKLGGRIYTNFYSKHFNKKYNITDIDLIHFWNLHTAMTYLEYKYIVSCHGMELLDKFIKGHMKVLYPKVLSNALKIHANSNYTRSLIINNFGIAPEKVVVIPPSINYRKLSQIKIKRKDKITIGSLARFTKRKNILNIIKALNIIKNKSNLDFIYFLAGNGYEKNNIMKELKKAKFKWKYFGEISDKDKINEFYPSLDVFVMPPLELPNDVEGFGIVYLEANAYGIPVVASKTGGIEDAVKEHVSGLFADPTKPEDIAIKILKVLKNKDKYYKSARKWAERYDMKRISERFARLYNNIKSQRVL